MAKTSGIGDRLFAGGYDLSGDIGALQAVTASQGLQDMTGLDKAALERGPLLRDGEISFNNVFFNPSAGQSHAVLKALQSGADIHVIYCRGTTLGNAAACLIAKQVDYNTNRGADGSLLGSVQTLGSAGFGLEWGTQVTAGKVNSTADENLTGVDMGIPASLGLVAYLQVFSLTGNDVTFTLEGSEDDGTDPYAAITGGAFAQVTAAPNTQRIATAADQAIEEWVRVAVTGDYSSVDFAIVVIVPGAHSTAP